MPEAREGQRVVADCVDAMFSLPPSPTLNAGPSVAGVRRSPSKQLLS